MLSGEGAMMQNLSLDSRESFVVPSRILRGSKRDMLADIDQAIVGLLALRHLIDDGAPPPDALALGGRRRRVRRGFRWPRFLTALRPMSFGR
jgi:hypothetical protein